MKKQRKIKVKRNEKKQFKLRPFLFFLMILSLLIFLMSLFWNSSQILDRKEINAKLRISNVTGLQVTNESLDFGRIIYGSNAQKSIKIKNNYNFPIKVEFSVEGNIKPFLIYQKVVYLSPGESKNISVSTITVTDEPYGFYSGEMLVVFKRAQ